MEVSGQQGLEVGSTQINATTLQTRPTSRVSTKLNLVRTPCVEGTQAETHKFGSL